MPCSNPPSLKALARLFPGFEGEIGDRIDTPPNRPAAQGRSHRPTTHRPPTTPGTDTSSGTPDAVQLLDEADALFDEADEALAEGDLGTYQSKIDEARAKLTEASAPRRTALIERLARQRAGSAETFGEFGEVLAELDLIAGLLGGETLRSGLDRLDVVADLAHLVGQFGRHGRDSVVEQRHP